MKIGAHAASRFRPIQNVPKVHNAEHSRMKTVPEAQLSKFSEITGTHTEVARCAVQVPRCCSGSDAVKVLRGGRRCCGCCCAKQLHSNSAVALRAGAGTLAWRRAAAFKPAAFNSFSQYSAETSETASKAASLSNSAAANPAERIATAEYPAARSCCAVNPAYV